MYGAGGDVLSTISIYVYNILQKLSHWLAGMAYVVAKIRDSRIALL